jgi:hypothetical protein
MVTPASSMGSLASDGTSGIPQAFWMICQRVLVWGRYQGFMNCIQIVFVAG